MAQQTAYNNNPAAALAGMVRWTEGTRIWSKVAEGAVGVGLLVVPGAQSMSAPIPGTPTAGSGQAGTVKAMAAGIADDPILDSEWAGIPILDTALAVGTSDQVSTGSQGTFNYTQYNDKQALGLLRKGAIWVYAQEAPTQFGDVYVYTTVQTNIPRGSFGYGAGSGKVKFGRGRWLMTLSNPGLALMEVW